MSDWANDFAANMAADLVSVSVRADVLELWAAKLRLLRHEGVMDGTKQASAAIDEIFKKAPEANPKQIDEPAKEAP